MAEMKKKGWGAGQSGNPKGRPKGSGDVAKMRQMIERQIPEILEILMLQALAGDTGAAKLLLERTLPPLRPVEQSQPINIPVDGLAEQGRAVLAAVASGQLATSQGSQLIGAIGSLARVVECDELAQRITALERAHK